MCQIAAGASRAVPAPRPHGQQKGTYDLVNAFAALPDAVRARARLMLAGDGDVEAIRKLAEPFGEQMRVLPWIDSAERERLLAQSDVFVLPSYHEGVPMALLEAMAAGLPAIVTPVGGIPDVLRTGVEGLMVEPARVTELSAAMARLVNQRWRADRVRAAGPRTRAQLRCARLCAQPGGDIPTHRARGRLPGNSMNAVATLAGFMKKHVLGQSMSRRNPYYYERSLATLAQGDGASFEQRLAWSDEQVRRTLALAKRTGYGRTVRGGLELSKWPLLDKESLRHDLKSFTSGKPWLSAPANHRGHQRRAAADVALDRGYRVRAGHHRSRDPVGGSGCAPRPGCGATR